MNQVNTSTNANKERLYYFDNFRAIAIFIIVLGHCYFDWGRGLFYEKSIVNAITGGTALFVFISGFFLHRVFYVREVGYKPFIIKKMIAVGIPYVILSSLYMFFFWLAKGNIPTYSTLKGLPASEIITINYLTGRHMVAYWYIPFVLVLFVLTPLFYSFIELPRKKQYFLTIVLFFASSFIFWRPASSMNACHSVLYFAPFYMLGILFSLNEKYFLNLFHGLKSVLLIFWLGVLFFMTDFGQWGNVSKVNPMQYEGVDFMVLQKFLLIIFLISVLYSFLNYRVKALNFIANNSFPIFFIHGWIIVMIESLSDLNFSNSSFIHVFVLSVVIFSSSLLLSVIGKKLLSNYSRFVIGA